MSRDGHIELDWAVDAIRVGPRARRDLGDLLPLVDSIRAYGLLQPITISPDGVLLCGARRLAAVKQLGQRIVNVWVRSGVSTRLERLVVEQDENTLRKPLLPTEAAALYRELRQIFAEDAARSRDASVPGAAAGGERDAKLARTGVGPARVRAARMVTGGSSYTTLERVGRVQQVVDDPTLPDDVRQFAAAALTLMDEDRKVDGHFRRVQAAVEDARRRQLIGLAEAAISRASAGGGAGSAAGGAAPQPVIPMAGSQVPRQLGVRAFLLTWDELSQWSERYDATSIGRELTDLQWANVVRTVQETNDFFDRARLARAEAG